MRRFDYMHLKKLIFLTSRKNVDFLQITWFYDEFKTSDKSVVFQAVGEIPTLMMFLVPLKVITHIKIFWMSMCLKFGSAVYYVHLLYCWNLGHAFQDFAQDLDRILQIAIWRCRTTPADRSESRDSKWEIRVSLCRFGIDCGRLNMYILYLAHIRTSQDLVRATLGWPETQGGI